MQLLSRVEPAAESAVHITLAQAVLKGDKMDDVVRDAVMLGVAGHSADGDEAHRDDRGGAACGARASTGGAAWRWRRSKQSRRAVLPEIRTAAELRELSRRAAAGSAADARRTGRRRRPRSRCRSLRGEPMPSDAAVSWGPRAAGPSEWQAARKRGVRLVTLGQRTLRADAVPIAAISVLQFLWDA